MTYWKGLVVAVALDLVWILARPTRTAPATVAPIDVVAEWPADNVPDDDAPETVEDSLMSHLQSHPEDVDAMLALADVYGQSGAWDAAINPLARAIQLAPSRRRVWASLNDAIEKAGLGKMTDAELERRAAEFRELLENYGHSC